MGLSSNMKAVRKSGGGKAARRRGMIILGVIATRTARIISRWIAIVAAVVLTAVIVSVERFLSRKHPKTADGKRVAGLGDLSSR